VASQRLQTFFIETQRTSTLFYFIFLSVYYFYVSRSVAARQLIFCAKLPIRKLSSVEFVPRPVIIIIIIMTSSREYRV